MGVSNDINKIVGVNIRRFREQRGWSQGDLGRHAGGVTHAAISDIELGKTAVRLDMLHTLATVLAAPLTTLLEQPFELKFRAEAGDEDEDIEEVLACIREEEAQLRSRELELYGDITQEAGVRRLARHHFYNVLGFEEPPARLEVAWNHWNVEYKEKRLKATISGFFYHRNTVKIIVVNSQHALVRRRMTAAHELGHLFAGGSQIHYTKSILDRVSQNREEQLAFAYAQELLMPSDWVLRKASVAWWVEDPEGIAAKCQVSAVAYELWARAQGLIGQLSDPVIRQRHDALLRGVPKKFRPESRYN